MSELEEESRLQDADVSGASLQSELAHSLDSDQDRKADGHRDARVSPRSANPHAPGRLSAPLLFPGGLTPHRPIPLANRTPCALRSKRRSATSLRPRRRAWSLPRSEHP